MHQLMKYCIILQRMSRNTRQIGFMMDWYYADKYYFTVIYCRLIGSTSEIGTYI